MDLLYIGQTGFKDMDLCFNKILSPKDVLIKNKTIVTVDDPLLIQRLMATGRFKETSIVKEEDKIDEVIYEDDVIEEIEEEYDEEED